MGKIYGVHWKTSCTACKEEINGDTVEVVSVSGDCIRYYCPYCRTWLESDLGRVWNPAKMKGVIHGRKHKRRSSSKG